MNYTKILLVGIYAPNENQEEFYAKLHRKMLEYEYEDICIIGYFNAIVDNELDYKSTEVNKKSRKTLLKTFHTMVDKLSLQDAWGFFSLW